jgi:RNA polymerase sigma-70 factor (ECF subfamily)
VALYAELEKPLYNVVYRTIWDAGESQDIVQESFLRCWRRRSQIRPEGLKAVLYRTALNLAINRRRRLKLWRFVGMEVAEIETSDDGKHDETIPRRIREAVDAVPDRYRSVLLLTEIAGMNYAEVAGTLGISEGTVGSRRSRALALVRKALEPEAADEVGSRPVAMKLEGGELL